MPRRRWRPDRWRRLPLRRTSGAASAECSGRWSPTSRARGRCTPGRHRRYRRHAPGRTQNLTYDAEGRTASVSTPSGTSTNTSKYLYDADGNLLEQTSTVSGTDKTRILYLFGGTEQITQNVSAKTCTGLRNYTGPDGTTITRSSSGTVTYQVANAQGTATTAIDASTLAVTRRFYDPYGNPRGTKPTTWVAADENHGFLGQPTDATTGLNLLGARNYDATLGRFLTPDPIFQAGDPNQMGGYTYAADNPASGSDPTGYDDWYRHKSLNPCVVDCTPHPTPSAGTPPTDTSSGSTSSSTASPAPAAQSVPYANPPDPNAGNLIVDVAVGFWDMAVCTFWLNGGGQSHTDACDVAGGLYSGGLVDGPEVGAVGAAEEAEGAIESDAAAAAGAGTKAVNEATSDAEDLANLKRANAQGQAQKAEAAAAKPSDPGAGSSGTKPASAAPRGTTSRGEAGAKSRPSYSHTESAPPGWAPAGQLARGEHLARAAAVANRTSKTSTRSYVSGYHIETGDLAVASSGPGPGGCALTYCAEGNVVNLLGGDWTKIRFGTAYVAERSDNGFIATGKYVCPKCQLDYPQASVGEGVAGDPEGSWYESR